ASARLPSMRTAMPRMRGRCRSTSAAQAWASPSPASRTSSVSGSSPAACRAFRSATPPPLVRPDHSGTLATAAAARDLPGHPSRLDLCPSAPSTISAPPRPQRPAYTLNGSGARFRRGNRSTAGAERTAVEMEMVAGGSVVIRRQHRIVTPAGAVPNVAQESLECSAARPAADDGDPPAVRKDEGRDVERVGGGVLAAAAALAAIDVAAGEAAEMLHPGDPTAEVAFGRGLKGMPLE